MSRDALPRSLARALHGLERRLFLVLLGYGVGRIALLAAALLVALYGLDRLFVPPAPVRVVLALGALGVLAHRAWRDLLGPMRERPRRRDLAALFERRYPRLQDRLATAVAAARGEASGSPALLAEVVRQAETACAELRARDVVPTGRARRSVLIATAAAGALLVAALQAPQEAAAFWNRLLGGAHPWPSDTRLVLLPAYVEGSTEPTPPRALGGEEFALDVARGSVVSLRVRAEGEVPQRVTVEGLEGRRHMHAVGAGDFVLRLPPLQESRTLSFRGGDDRDGLPRLRLRAGDAPEIASWWVRVEPPEYAGLPAQEGELHEVSALRHARITLRFTADRPVSELRASLLDGSEVPVTRTQDGTFEARLHMDASNELAVALTGEDDFERRRAGVLTWTATQDRGPQLRFLHPDGRWLTVPGAAVPAVIEAGDDFGLERLQLFGFRDEEIPLDASLDARTVRETLRVTAPQPNDAESAAATRFRLRLSAQDGALPEPHLAEAESAWIEVLPPAVYEQRLAERMVRLRERVETLQERVARFVAGEVPVSLVRRTRRDLDGMLDDTETDLLQRLYSGLDRATAPLLPSVEEVLARPDALPGSVTDALLEAPGGPPLDRAGLLLDLSHALRLTRDGPAEALLRAVAAGEDPQPHVRELRAELDRILEILIAWEDFHSAVNLLRSLLERQRGLYLRTQEASER